MQKKKIIIIMQSMIHCLKDAYVMIYGFVCDTGVAISQIEKSLSLEQDSMGMI